MVLGQLGRWFETTLYRSGAAGSSEFAAVSPPTRYATDYRRYLRANAQEAEWSSPRRGRYQLGA